MELLVLPRSETIAGVRRGAYKVTDWAKYNEALVNRGSWTLWLARRR